MSAWIRVEKKSKNILVNVFPKIVIYTQGEKIMKSIKLSVSFLFLTMLVMTLFMVNCAVPTKISGQKLYELKYQFPEGTKFTMTSTGDVSSITDQMGTEVVADIYGEGEDSYVVLSADKEKGLTLELEYGQRSQTVDSTAGSNSTDFSELIGQKVKFVLLQNGKVEGFEGFDNLPEITTSTGEVLTAETYKLGVHATFPLLPDNPVKIGDSWSDIQDIDIPSGDNILLSENNFTYTLIEETVKDGFECLKIAVKGVVKLSGNFEQGGTPLYIERETKSAGTLYFAHKKGMLLSIETESTGEGVINVPSAGIDIPQTITSKSSVTVRFEK
jgi:hypothetical protein